MPMRSTSDHKKRKGTRSQNLDRKRTCNATSEADDFTMFGGAGSSMITVYPNFGFEFSMLLQKDNPTLYANCLNFGNAIHENYIHNEGKNHRVIFRSWMMAQHPITRLTHYLLDCTAFLKEEQIQSLKTMFRDVLFPVPAARTVFKNLRIITTGALRVILLGFSRFIKQRKSARRIGAYKEIADHKTVASHMDDYADYAQLASSLIEIFYYDFVRVNHNKTTQFGLVSNMKRLNMHNQNGPYLCCSVNLKTNAECTKLTETDYDRHGNVLSKISNGTGIFGVNYLINSANVGEEHYQNCIISVRHDVKLSVYCSRMKSFDNSRLLEVSFNRIKSGCALRYGDELLWSYDIHHYQGEDKIRKGLSDNELKSS